MPSGQAQTYLSLLLLRRHKWEHPPFSTSHGLISNNNGHCKKKLFGDCGCFKYVGLKPEMK